MVKFLFHLPANRLSLFAVGPAFRPGCLQERRLQGRYIQFAAFLLQDAPQRFNSSSTISIMG
jgi:hypothetical protein